MTYKPWKKISEAGGPMRPVSGKTLGATGNNSLRAADHQHSFDLRHERGEDGVAIVVGSTDEVDGHSHTISQMGRTDPAADDHFHMLPDAVRPGVTPGTNEPAARPEALDVAGLLSGGEKELGEKLDSWIGQMSNFVRGGGAGEPNPLKNPSKPAPAKRRVVKPTQRQ